MSAVFEGRIRRLGNSMAVIIPREILEETGAKEGDLLKLSVPIRRSGRDAALRRMIGRYPNAGPFKREKDDRV